MHRPRSQAASCAWAAVATVLASSMLTAADSVPTLASPSAALRSGAVKQPHIVFVVADDLGFGDVPFTSADSNVLTPTLSALANEGVVLNNAYVNPICTPTRSNLMTGRMPIHTGLQCGVIRDAFPQAVPINMTLLPQHMAALNYRTHMVGKWHCGFLEPRYTPQRRGFETCECHDRTCASRAGARARKACETR